VEEPSVLRRAGRVLLQAAGLTLALIGAGQWLVWGWGWLGF
jgi:hypothetical protein